MSATAAMIARVRRMVAEPTTATYDDAAITGYIEAYPTLDGEGREPDHSDWEPIYDLHAAAADIWEEKAASYAGAADFTADGLSYRLSASYEQMMAQVRRHRAQRTPKTMIPKKWPKERQRAQFEDWIGNLPERND